MKHFMRLGKIDPNPLMLAIRRRPELWDQNTLRTTHPDTPHKQVSDIWLRFNDLQVYEKTGDAASVIDEHESIDYPAYKLLHEARPLVMNLMAAMQGERLGRVLIAKLEPGGVIDPHIDGGSHAEYYTRFHLVLHGLPGCVIRCEDEQLDMRTGDVFWFNNRLEHSVANNSCDDRVTLIVDIRTSR